MFSKKVTLKNSNEGEKLMESKSLSNVWKMKSAPNNDVNADDIFVNVEFNSSYFTSKMVDSIRLGFTIMKA